MATIYQKIKASAAKKAEAMSYSSPSKDLDHPGDVAGHTHDEETEVHNTKTGEMGSVKTTSAKGTPDKPRLTYSQAWAQNKEGINDMYASKEDYIKDLEGQKYKDPVAHEKKIVKELTGEKGKVTYKFTADKEDIPAVTSVTKGDDPAYASSAYEQRQFKRGLDIKNRKNLRNIKKLERKSNRLKGEAGIAAKEQLDAAVLINKGAGARDKVATDNFNAYGLSNKGNKGKSSSSTPDTTEVITEASTGNVKFDKDANAGAREWDGEKFVSAEIAPLTVEYKSQAIANAKANKPSSMSDNMTIGSSQPSAEQMREDARDVVKARHKSAGAYKMKGYGSKNKK